MNFRKTAAIVAAAGALTAVALPAMAFENEIHGMYRAYGFVTNSLYGGPGFNLKSESRTDKFIEQRARLQYTAKASDDLKLVTHFELDTKFGGSQTATKYSFGDAGNLDADKITLETKSVYLDFKIPAVPVRAKVGIQPYRDSFQDVFGYFDATGAVLTGTFGPVSATYGYFTVGNAASSTTPNSTVDLAFPTNDRTKDLNVLDLKFAVNKDISVGTSYYAVLNKPGSTGASAAVPAGFILSQTTGLPVATAAVAAKAASTGPTLVNNTIGLNADAKFGPAAITASLGYQFGKTIGNKTSASVPTNAVSEGVNTSAFAATVAAKVAVGAGKVNLAALYLSGDKNNTGDNHAWESIGDSVNYFGPANMWLLTRNITSINSSTQIGGGTDITRGGLGIMGVFGGYEGTVGKLFYNANVGYAQVAYKRDAIDASIGTEINSTIGYKLYDNMSASFIAAYAFLGDGYGKNTGKLINTPGVPTSRGPNGVNGADNPFLTAIALNYVF